MAPPLVGRLVAGLRRSDLQSITHHRVAAAALPARPGERLWDQHRTGAALRRGLPAVAAGARRRASASSQQSRARTSRCRPRSRCAARAEHALQRSEEKFAAAFHSNPCAMAITLFDEGRIVDVNDVCVRQSGYARDELIGSNSDELGFWVDPCRARERHRRARRARPRRHARGTLAQKPGPGRHRPLLRRHARGRRRAMCALGRRGHHGAQAGRGHAIERSCARCRTGYSC